MSIILQFWNLLLQGVVSIIPRNNIQEQYFLWFLIFLITSAVFSRKLRSSGQPPSRELLFDGCFGEELDKWV